MNEHRPWINFKELRTRLNFEDVLRHYNVEVRRRGDQHLGPCPLPGHPQDKEGSTFSANIPRGIFQCFACKAKGNVLDFAGLMAGLDIEDGSELRKVAVELQSKFFPEGASRRTRPASKGELAPPPVVAKVNAPLDFALKGLDPKHEALAGFGFAPETLAHFGAGYCARGSLKGKLAVPLHDRDGALVGYAAAAPSEALLFTLPESREREGTKLVFDAQQILYNAHRIEAPCEELWVVDSLPSVWRLWERGIASVATNDGSLVDAQVEIVAALIAPGGRVLRVCEAGKGKGGSRAAELLASRCFVRLVVAGAPLSEMPEAELASLFA